MFQQTASAVDRTRHRRPLYTPEQRVRRDNSRWTLVQGILAPIQFLVFLVSTVLVALLQDWWTTADRMILALVAYVVYAVNAVQFLLKLRAARLDEARQTRLTVGVVA